MSKRSTLILTRLVVVVILVLCLLAVSYAAPNKISLQGKLTDSSGIPQTGTYNFTFTIYNQSSGGQNLYQVVNRTLATDSNGIYDVIIEALNISFENPLFLGISVQGGDEMTPRINLTSSPYAFYANTSGGLDPNNTYHVEGLNATVLAVLGSGGESEVRIQSLSANLSGGGDLSIAGYIRATGTEASYIFGSVGIGTAAPNDKLVVIGNVNTTGNLFVDGIIYGSLGAGNITGELLDSQVDEDLTIQTTNDVTIGGGYGSGGISLYATGDDKGSGFFANDILIDGQIVSVFDVSVNQSFIPSIDNLVTLGNASRRFSDLYIVNVHGGNATVVFEANVSINGNLTVDSPNLRVTGLDSADCDLKADTDGNFFCGTDATGNDGTTFNEENITGLALNISSLNVTGDVVIEGGNLSVGTQKENDTFTLEGGFYNIPPTPRLVSEAEIGFILRDMYVSGGYAYVVGNGNPDFVIFDVSNPREPVELGGINTDSILDIEVRGSYAYIVSSAGDLRIIDTTNKTDPVIVGEILDFDTAEAYEVEVLGDYAYVTTRGTPELHIFDIKNPTNPSLVSATAIDDRGLGLFLSWPYAYVSNRPTAGHDIEVFDIADPRNVEKVGFADGEGGTHNELYVSGGLIYAATTDGSQEFKIYNATDLNNIHQIGYVDLPNNPNALQVVGRYAFVGGDNSGQEIFVIDVSDPSNPYNMTAVDVSDGVLGLFVSGKYMYVASGSVDEEFHVFDIGGLDTHAAQIGSIEANTLFVKDNADFANKVTAQNGLDVGRGGLMVQGPATFMNNTLNIDYRGFVNITRGGLNITGGLSVSELNSADCDLKSDTSGNFYCGTDSGGGGGDVMWNSSGPHVFLNDSTGRVGIGTGAPSEKLVVLGNLSINRSTGVTTTFWVDSTDGMVGIGTSAPRELLHLEGSTSAGILINNTGDGQALIVGGRNTDTTDANLLVMEGQWDANPVARVILNAGDDTANSDDGYITFAVGQSGTVSEAMRIEQDGNIGIGTDNPAFTLTVDGTFNASSAGDSDLVVDSNGQVGVGINDAADPLHIVTDSGGQAIHIEEPDGGDGEDWQIGVESDGDLMFENSGVDAIVFQDSNEVGIGVTDPGEPLHIEADSGSDVIRLEENGGDNEYIDIEVDSEGDLNIKTDGGDNALTLLDAGGNVGMGTLSPTERLVLVGNLSINNTLGISTALFVDSTNNFTGIGTSSPNAPLQISSTRNGAILSVRTERSGGNSTIHLRQSNEGMDARIIFAQENGISRFGFLMDDSSGGGVSTNEYLTIQEDGSVGVGAIHPSEKFVVMGNLSINHSDGTSSALIVDSTNVQVGIGGASTEGTLHVGPGDAGTVTAESNAAEFVVETDGNGGMTLLGPSLNTVSLKLGSPADSSGGVISMVGTTGLMKVGTSTTDGELQITSASGTTAMTVDSNQEVGIGSTTPAERLTVVGNMSTTLTNNTFGDFSMAQFNSSCAGFRFGSTGGWILSCE